MIHPLDIFHFFLYLPLIYINIYVYIYIFCKIHTHTHISVDIWYTQIALPFCATCLYKYICIYIYTYIYIYIPPSDACSDPQRIVEGQEDDGRTRHPSHPSHLIAPHIQQPCANPATDWDTSRFKANVSQTRAVTPWNRNVLWSKSSQTRMLHAVCATQSNLYMLPLTHARRHRRHLHNSLTRYVNLPVLCKSGQQNAIGKCHASAETSVPIR